MDMHYPTQLCATLSASDAVNGLSIITD